MAQEWAKVPEYAAALERVLGEDGAARLLDEFEQRADELAGHARGVFERWLDQAARVVTDEGEDQGTHAVSVRTHAPARARVTGRRGG